MFIFYRSKDLRDQVINFLVTKNLKTTPENIKRFSNLVIDEFEHTSVETGQRCQSVFIK
jgi:hypothetical protein